MRSVYHEVLRLTIGTVEVIDSPVSITPALMPPTFAPTAAKEKPPRFNEVAEGRDRAERGRDEGLSIFLTADGHKW